MGAPLLAYVQNSVQDVRVRVSSWLVMCGSTASVRGQLLRDCGRGACYCGTAGAGPATAVVCSAASFIWEGRGCAFWIGTADLDRLFSYLQRHNLSSSWFPIHLVAAHVRPRPHADPMICAWALSSARGQRRLRAGYGVYVCVKGLTGSSHLRV